jgi:hypothetical protein|nr:MAG TPA: tail protein [Caudoviricetes sp.]
MGLDRLIYVNEIGQIIEFSLKSPFILQRVEGLDGLQNDIHTTKGVLQDGVLIIGSNLKERNITIGGTIVRDQDNNREKLIKIVNPKLKGKLIHERNNRIKQIVCEVEQAPTVTRKAIPEYFISILCPNPYWEDEYETGQEISTWIGGLSFPFSLPFRLKQRGETRQNIYNAGDVETPVEIIFRGPALNPKVTNLTTGEFIRIKQELASDDTLYITTDFGNKKVELETHGVRINAFNYIDLDSTFFSLIVGDNLIEYTTESELISKGVEIRYYNRYLGV